MKASPNEDTAGSSAASSTVSTTRFARCVRSVRRAIALSLSAVLLVSWPVLVWRLSTLTRWITIRFSHSPVIEVALFLGFAWSMLLCRKPPAKIRSVIRLASTRVLKATFLQRCPTLLAGHINYHMIDLGRSVAASAITFLAVNCLVNAIPDGLEFETPGILRFMDSSGDGVLRASDIEDFFFFFSRRVLLAVLATHFGRFILRAKDPPAFNAADEPHVSYTTSQKNVMRKLAAEYDRDGKGFLNKKETQGLIEDDRALKLLRELSVTPQQANDAFQFIDRDKDGLVSQRELAYGILGLGGSPARPLWRGQSAGEYFWHTLVHKFLLDRQSSARPGHGAAMCLDKIIDIGMWVFMIYPWFAVFQVNVRTVLAVGGVGGLALGLAAKNLAANLIAGLMIYINLTVVKGQEVEIPNGHFHGVVASVGATTTVVNQLDGKPLLVPNSRLLEGMVVDKSTRYFRKVESTFNVILKDVADLAKMVESIANVLHNHDRVLKKDAIKAIREALNGDIEVFPAQCVFKGFGPHGALIHVRCYVPGRLHNDAFQQARSEILIAVAEKIGDLGGSIGFNCLVPLPALGASGITQQDTNASQRLGS